MDYAFLLARPRVVKLLNDIDTSVSVLQHAETYATLALHKDPDRDMLDALEVQLRMSAELAFHAPGVLEALNIMEGARAQRQKLDKAARAKARRQLKRAAL